MQTFRCMEDCIGCICVALSIEKIILHNEAVNKKLKNRKVNNKVRNIDGK